jgi:predicted nucleotidyltransferase
MTEMSDNLLTIAREKSEEIAKKPGVLGIAVFGSIARGVANKGSDIDLLVVADVDEVIRFRSRYKGVYVDEVSVPIEILKDLESLPRSIFVSYAIYGCSPLHDPQKVVSRAQAFLLEHMYDKAAVKARLSARLSKASSHISDAKRSIEKGDADSIYLHVLLFVISVGWVFIELIERPEHIRQKEFTDFLSRFKGAATVFEEKVYQSIIELLGLGGADEVWAKTAIGSTEILQAICQEYVAKHSKELKNLDEKTKAQVIEYSNVQGYLHEAKAFRETDEFEFSLFMSMMAALQLTISMTTLTLTIRDERALKRELPTVLPVRVLRNEKDVADAFLEHYFRIFGCTSPENLLRKAELCAERIGRMMEARIDLSASVNRC